MNHKPPETIWQAASLKELKKNANRKIDFAAFAKLYAWIIGTYF